ncbi:MAG TPA: hypothetical protein VM099_13530 [Gemmatimonadaceae bacterium]|nr:hypothetical protein [Gemmatimonadaceae bacterium]
MLPLSDKELDEMVALERSRGAPPLTDWDSIASQLRAEGIIRERTLGSRFTSRTWMQAAAAVVLVAGGIAVGRYTAQRDVIASPSSIASTTATPAQSAGGAPVQPVSTSSPISTADFKSVDEAWATLNRAGEEYQRASAFLSASNNVVPLPNDASTYRTRLAALDNVMSEMGKAMHEAPHDPVINQYYMATVGAREATLRQLGTTLPAGMKLNRF